MADHVNLGFELGDGTGVPTGWTRTTHADKDAAGYKRAENLLQYSEEFDNAFWPKGGCTITADQDAGPFDDPADPADLLVEDSGTSRHEAIVTGIVAYTSRVTQSVYAKADGRSILTMRGNDPWGTMWFDLNAGVVANVSSNWADNAVGLVEDMGDGWYRCSCTRTKDTPGNPTVVGFGAAEDNENTSYTGDGRDALLLYGAQFEDANAPSVYVRVTSAAARVDQGHDSYEHHWGGNEGYLEDIDDGAGATAAEYDVAAVDPVTYEAYEEEWGNTGYAEPPLVLSEAAGYFTGENLLAWSEGLDEAGSWGVLNGSIDADSAGVPTGFAGQADRLVENSSAGLHAVSQVVTTTGTRIVLSGYLKKDQRNWVYLYLTGSGDWAAVWFDLNNGVVGTSLFVGCTVEGATIEDAGNGYYRCTIDVSGLAAGSVTASYRSATGDFQQTHTGNSLPAFALIGAQLVHYGSPLDYIKTEADAGAITEAQERYEREWDNSTYYEEWDDVLKEAATWTQGLAEDYEDDWGNATWLTPPFTGGQITVANYDSQVPQTYEDYETEWSLMTSF